MSEVKPVFVDGKVYHLFGVEYIFDGARYEFHIRATDFDEARERVKLIKKSARLCGQITDIIAEDEVGGD